MCHETNHRCAAAVQHMQNVSLAVELRRRLVAYLNLRRELPLTEYGSGFVDALDVAIAVIDELAPAPDYSQCDNPPESVKPVGQWAPVKPSGRWHCGACGREWDASQLYFDPHDNRQTCGDLTCGATCKPVDPAVEMRRRLLAEIDESGKDIDHV